MIRNARWLVIASAFLYSLIPLSTLAQTTLPGATAAAGPPPLAMDLTAYAEKLAPVDAVVRNAIAAGHTPGAVVLIGHQGKVIYRRAFGNRSLEPTLEPMTVDTVFDMASLTKVIATTGSVMRMVQQGQIKLNDPVARYIPEFAQNGKGEVTIRQLMTHYSGLRPDLDLKPEWTGQLEAFRLANAEKLTSPPGSTFVYSDINFIVLGELVQKLSGMTLNRYAETFIFTPLGMTESRFLPPQSWFMRIAPTAKDERSGIVLRGLVHDPTARNMGGVAGHAGLFSTADDTAKFAQALLNGGAPVWSKLTVEKMTTPQQPPNMTVLRGLGWDIDSPYSTNRGDLLPVGSFGHTGFTGTSLWIDPTTDTYIVILTNAVHVKGGNVVTLRSEVATAVAAGLELNPAEAQKMRVARITGYNELLPAGRRVTVRNGEVKTGIDVLEEQNFGALKVAGVAKPRVGLVTNQTGVDSQGRRTIDVLAKVPQVQLTAIFSPEHGVAGTADTADITNSKDATTGVPIYGVYGDTDAKRRPTAEQLKGIDVLVFDIQDAGVRFFTYETTLGYFLEAASKANKSIVVLDRPNPLNGAYVQGPVSDGLLESFTNYHSVPIRHGMTLGELAKMYNTERKVNANLTVVPMKGWLRGDWFDSTGLEWINPSPNLRGVAANTLYPGVELLQFTNVSVGRGTDTPFLWIGAPWIKPRDLASYLNARLIPGVRFVPMEFTPTSATNAGQKCGGVQIIVVNRETVDAPEMGIELATALHKLYPGDFDLLKMNTLLANQAAFQELQAGRDPRRIEEDWRDALDRFMTVRAKYLIYPEK
ncbi:MAG TPA: exo-beta-N-acetylmuramidase NamZ domain-containing protein [Candidatus Angelobacter sp.]|nr:exo-beta-N-acetylmuramidase NamZ domain-containing protein [Candidatus Angelobacter sp.]